MKRPILHISIAFASLLVPAVSAGQSSDSALLTVLHAFEGGTDGNYPEAGLIHDGSETFYGASGGDGGQSNQGTIFKISAAGTETILYRFGPVLDGQAPLGPLVKDQAGNLYGTTLLGGSGGVGTVFKLSKSGEETVLYNFLGGNDGANPRGGLVRDAMGNLYGTTVQGGGSGCSSIGCGTVFKISPEGAETILHRFGGAPDGANPEKGLIADAAGNLYGTTFVGGVYNYGTIYKLSPNGEEKVLHSFAGPPNGAYPWGTLHRNATGDLFGTGLAGGTSTLCSPGCGTIFKLSKGGKESTLHSFSGQADGDQPYGNLVSNKAGDFFGTTFGGGNPACNGGGGCGTVFELSTAGRFTTLHRFAGADGANPYDGLVLDGAGNLYGTTFFGGSDNYGVVFKLTP